MITIQIDEHLNGFSLVGFDWKNGGKFLDEIQEERLQALRSIDSWVNKEIIKELEARQQYAGHQ